MLHSVDFIKCSIYYSFTYNHTYTQYSHVYIQIDINRYYSLCISLNIISTRSVVGLSCVGVQTWYLVSILDEF